MKNMAYGFSILSYMALACLYFVNREYLIALSVWVLLLAVKAFFKPLREQLALLFLVGLCFLFLNILYRIGPWFHWPLDFYLTALFGFCLLRFVIRKPTESLKWSFSFSRAEIASLFIINIPAIAILIWYFKSNPEVANMWPVPELPIWSLPFVVLFIAAINGLREEIFFRGLLQPASAKTSPIWFQIALQAVLFGFLHFLNAFPQGWTGVLLTGIWGAAIAIQYQLFKSISLSWVTHAVADAIMFAIIIYTRMP